MSGPLAGLRVIELCDELGDPRHGATLVRLATTADILIEERPPGTLAALGLAYSELRTQNSELIAAGVFM